MMARKVTKQIKNISLQDKDIVFVLVTTLLDI